MSQRWPLEKWKPILVTKMKTQGVLKCVVRKCVVVWPPYLKHHKQLHPRSVMMTLFSTGSKIQKPKSKIHERPSRDMKNQKETHIVTIAQSLSNRQKNEKPLSHVTKTTPNASVKNLFHYRNMVLHANFHFFESPKWKYENENPKNNIQFDCPHYNHHHGDSQGRHIPLKKSSFWQVGVRFCNFFKFFLVNFDMPSFQKSAFSSSHYGRIESFQIQSFFRLVISPITSLDVQEVTRRTSTCR